MQLHKLLHKSSKGDRRAQKHFFDLYADRLFAIAKRYSNSYEMAEEALFQAFLKIFEKLSDFEFINEAALIGWLKRIVINQALMDRRKEMNTLYKLETIDEERHDTLYFDKTNEETLIELVNELPDGYKTVFLMNVVDGYAHKEIAEILGITEGTSRSQFFKARKLLQKKINQEYVQSGT
ncbi:sigma-70 family RNA polymerase sigma factor [Prolixibacteraceae bacterium Z1-6]|uniref:Sigma-70 family RNA polymerase sigma factor n=1 Tax=Draconibacterium aestuarii TaxID=2998507 RepID=A0A9X3F5W1_9BACT|nr:sigma-70 family RNA polymerase sigma factor [Prolixibacteraceae bacterium Z1-6]